MKSFFFKCTLFFLSIFCLLGTVEIAFTIFYWIQDGKYTSVKDKLLVEKNAYLDKLVPQKKTYKDILFPHPYLSYVHKPLFQNFNHIGFNGPTFPFQKRKDLYFLCKKILLPLGILLNFLAGI